MVVVGLGDGFGRRGRSALGYIGVVVPVASVTRIFFLSFVDWVGLLRYSTEEIGSQHSQIQAPPANSNMSSNVRPDSGLLSGLRSDAQFVLETNGLRVASDVSSDTTYVVRAASGERLAAEERLENYEDVANAVQQLAQVRMMDVCNLQWQHFSRPSSVLRTMSEYQETPDKVLASTDFLTNQTGLLVLITGTGAVRAGIWGRQLCVADTFEHGSAVEIARWAILQRKYGVLAMDPNDPIFSSAGDNTEGGGGVEHCLTVWKYVLGRAKAANIFVIAHSFGGACFVDCLAASCVSSASPKEGRVDPRLRSVAFTDSVHFVEGECLQTGPGKLTESALDWLKNCGRQWLTGAEPLDTVEYEYNEACGCKCLSAGVEDHSSVNYAADLSIRQWFDECRSAAEKDAASPCSL